MARLLTCVAVLLFTVPPTGVHTQQLTESEVAEAIRLGQENDFDDLVSSCDATREWAGMDRALEEAISSILSDRETVFSRFWVTVAGSAGRIALAARKGQKAHVQVTPETIPDELRTQQLFVLVEGVEEGRSWPFLGNIVLRARQEPRMELQPRSIEREYIPAPKGFWGRVFGRNERRAIFEAMFSLEGAKSLTAGDIDVVLIQGASKYSCRIDRDLLQRIFQPSG